MSSTTGLTEAEWAQKVRNLEDQLAKAEQQNEHQAADLRWIREDNRTLNRSVNRMQQRLRKYQDEYGLI